LTSYRPTPKLKRRRISGPPEARFNDLERAVVLIRTVCELAGSMSFLDEVNAEIRDVGLDRAVASGLTPPVFDWLLSAFAYQGISDTVARTYMEKHGTASWSQIEASLRASPTCPKLRRYWHYESCRYDKGSFTCSEPDHIDACPLPRPHLRNGRLNQTAYSFFLFVRDIMGGDLIGWIDGQLEAATGSCGADLDAARQEALIGPLRNVYGVSDKVLTMALSSLLIGARGNPPIWFETGTAMMAIDTLVHNFLHRTGILEGCGTGHAYGAACYAEGGCAEIIRRISERIDARSFNRNNPKMFPRFVQHAIWRYGAADEFNVCNGNQIDDEKACENRYCLLHQKCDRKPLKST
jgi:hypothetical protein